MIARLLAIVLCMAALIAGVMWVSLELVGAVSEGADSGWYIALGLAIAAVAAVVVVTARSRTRGMVGLTGVMTVLLVAVVLTYPTKGEACTPTSGGDAVTDTTADPGGGLQVDDADQPAGGSNSTDCK
jgi:hypothetical protein